ncbi:FIG00483574: hypothetical protein [hydrothermal vent metagenome]|uniref:DUF4350 domain-containing protein n=1 Tax=hydrothermal vent metagenome TaxID=652676 RepID=A0A3B0RSQ1_9ZZZZ
MSAQSNPFKRSTILIMFAIGFAAFVALLYGMGTGDRLASGNNGQAHGASNSLVGYTALVEILRKTGTKVQYSRSPAGMDNPGLLILTPGAYSDAEGLAQVMQDRSYIGPTMIVLPKWQVMPLPTLKKGWVERYGTLDGSIGTDMLSEIVDVEIGTTEKPLKDSAVKLQSAIGGQITRPVQPTTMKGEYLRAITRDPKTGGALVGYYDDGGVYPQLDDLDESQITDEDEIDEGYFPLVIVADADLLNNSGMASKNTAKYALALIAAASAGTGGAVTFDLTFNGLGSSENLLTLAFEPPFLSATICLIAAAIAAAWMAFNRFGPPMRESRSIDFGKTALVNNSASFINRMRRDYLVAEPYAEMVRDDAAQAIGLSHATDRGEVNRKLDELGEVDGNRFSALFNQLYRAHDSREVADGAAALYLWKKEKIG